MKIAIVEDDINMRKSLELALSDDYEIVTFRIRLYLSKREH
jgi:DNA-binding response OmpR family regulator